jgi:predicted small lipoprotein YifL
MSSRARLSSLVLLLLLTGCGFQAAVEAPDSDRKTQQDAEANAAPRSTEPGLPATPSEPGSGPCQDAFEARELREPYQRYEPDAPRYTLSAQQYQGYLDLMGIEAICLPPGFGAPFLNVDWNAELLPATGRMVSLGFEELYAGGGWSRGYLVYATYDFSFGSEYEVFASPLDFEQLTSGSIPNVIDAGGARGFVRFHGGTPMGKQMLMKTTVFPFAQHYVAAVINLAAYERAEVESVLQEMEAGRHPDLMDKYVAWMDTLVLSMRFR